MTRGSTQKKNLNSPEFEGIRKLIKQGETINLEFKSSENKLPSNLFETVCAFLNREGGKILLGVDDTGKILGVNENAVNKLLKEITDSANNPEKLNPPYILFPKPIVLDGKTLILIDVPRSSQVHLTKSKIFDRSKDGDYELCDHSQKSKLYNRKNLEFSETKIYHHLELKHFRKELFKKVRNLLRDKSENHSLLELDDKDLLKALGLYKEDLQTGDKGYTLASVLLFGKDETIQNILPHFKIDILLRKKDTERYDDRLELRTNLIEAYERMMEYLQKNLPDPFYEENGIRISLRTKIFREIIANILVHAEYTGIAFTRLIIYKDRVETENPSKPFRSGLITVADISPQPKNPLLAKLFVQIGRAEELGSGIRISSKYVPIYTGGKQPQFVEGDIFRTIIPIPDEDYKIETVHSFGGGLNGGLNGGLSGGLNEDCFALLKLIQTGKYPRITHLMKELESSRRTLERQLADLKDQGLISYEGSKKSGAYVLSSEGVLGLEELKSRIKLQ
jgi:ATP-dependent DNA helicase RecG